MSILGIETATETCGVALMREGILLDEFSREEKHIHAEQLVPMVEQLLKKNNTELASLDGVAISIGPGSFTGLRIGLSVAKGLAESVNLPLVAVPTLTSVAFALKNTLHASEQTMVSVLEIQRNEFAVASFSSKRFFEHHSEVISVLQHTDSTAAIEQYFMQRSEQLLLCGPASEKIFRVLQNYHSLQEKIFLAGNAFRKCNARFVAFLGAQLLQQNDIADIPSLQPLYGKDFVAKQSTIFARITRNNSN
ncbi:MAG: tRNA (adenosine(37)-N6)-threonylcarbamoyltransferase complex dimerization subunit type 1 TsaB [Ignavibacteria bacterium]|nr:tRNA (adenosine(37)-N6)-threonylcarbamoyltransferase complex dimerization subunit type 1 TsaB [Ignavibacteria bacterium]